MKIGKKLKFLRKMRKMTLRGLSEKSGVQIATLSRMEHDIMTGTLASHMSICKALGVSVSDFYREAEDEHKHVQLSEKRSTASATEILTAGLSGKKMMPVLIHINKSARTPEEKGAVASEKFIYIVEGKIKAMVGNKEYNLRKGDSLYFDASLAHSFQNTARAESLALSVLCSIVLLFLILFARPIFAEEAELRPGMELKKIGAINVIVPKGSEIYEKNGLYILESAEEYAARKFKDVEERFALLEERAESAENKLEKLTVEIEELKEAPSLILSPEVD